MTNKHTEEELEELNDGQETENSDSASNKGHKSRKENKLKKALEEKEQELAEMKDKYLRLFAEFDNFKKRSVKERLELMKNAAQDTIIDLLPVLDDFERAKKSADDDHNDEVFSEGVSLVYHKLFSVLKAKGLNAMETDGIPFNPEFHEAITKIPTPTDEMKGKIIDTLTKGYMLHEKIIRHPKVVVGE